ncbi:3'-5' exonuclease [Flavobacteriaceae bacterium 14752]|uniref:3'-5' exonuclease n=1 Tax=Mesohalobacter salilacus TaxID=2491711 RepID=UPI000F630E5C|nr:3'-5' exonuclease [Flavobacteriaceae bacterium 14752]
MDLNLSKPLCFFDLETTGTNIAKDRIVEISILKVFPNQNKESITLRINPEMPIPKEVSEIHGIYDKDVENEPMFKELATKIYNFIKDSDLAGYNSNRFDIPLLAEEMLRAEVDFDMKNAVKIDVQTIFHKKEKRTLEAAYKFYCDKDLTDAHSAEADTNATYEVLKSQLDRYEDLENNTKWLSEFSAHKKFADFAGMVQYNKDGEEVFGFGKHKGKKVEDVLDREPGYYNWIQNADFPLYTKKVLTAIKLRKLATKS